MFPFFIFIGFLISIIVGLFSIFRLYPITSLKEALYLSFIKMLFVFILVFIYGLILNVFIKRQFRKKGRIDLTLGEEKP